jgi:predicted ATPase
MSLRSFEVSNYRAFVEPAKVELKELTLLFGYNNAGKSALARVLPLLRDSSFARRGLPLNLESAAVRGGEFEDLRSRQTGLRKISLVLEWSDPEIRKVRIVFQDLPERRQHVVESFEIEPPNGPTLYGEWVVPADDAMGPTMYSIQRAGEAEARVTIDWLGLIPQVAPGLPPEDERLMAALAAVTKELQGTLWVGAVRSMQPRRSKFPRLQPTTIEPDGKGSADVLAWDKRYGGDLFAAVSGWYAKNTSTPLDVAIRADDYEIVTGASHVNLSDTGEGLTQVLPVLVAGAMAVQAARSNQSSYLVIEQPELHLHPAAHAPLAEFFCTIAAAASAPKIVVETHSENFLFGVQLAVALGQLDPARVLIHWVRQDEQSYATVTPIRLDRDGRPDAWPKGVFTEEAELARQLLEARRRRSAP